MKKRHILILILTIAILASSTAYASEKNEVGFEVDIQNHVRINTNTFEAGEYSLVKEYGFRVMNWPDKSGENIKEIRMTFEPKQPDLIKRVETRWGTLESKDPYTAVWHDIPPNQGAEMNIITTTKEKTYVPITIKRDIDITWFETTGYQLVTVTATPEKDLESIRINIITNPDRYEYKEIADVEVISTSQEYYERTEEMGIMYFVKNAEEGKEYTFKVQLQITPLQEKATYIPSLWISVGSAQEEENTIIETEIEKKTKVGTIKVQSAEILAFNPQNMDMVTIHMEGVTTTTRFLEEQPTTTLPPTTTTAPTAGETPTPATKVTTPAQTQPLISTKTDGEEDSDGDGWSNDHERRAGTNPYSKDTDGDGLWDSMDPNPLVAEDRDQKEEVNWEQIGVILAITGAMIGGLLSSRKRRRIKKLLDDVDKTYESFKMNSRRCEAELYRHRDIVLEQLKKGKINEESYNILDKRIDNYLSEIRERIMEERFGKVPTGLKDEVHRMLEDGEINETEYTAFENILGKSKDIGGKEKRELKGLFKKWRDEDKVTGTLLGEYIDEYMKDIDKAKAKISGIELKKEIDKIMEDGIVTPEEYEEFSKMLDKSDLSEKEKEALKTRLRKIRDLSSQ